MPERARWLILYCWVGYLSSNPIWWFYMVIRPKPWFYVLVHGYTNRSSPDASTSYQDKTQRWSWVYTTTVPKRSQNQIVTANVVRSSSWCQQLVGNTPDRGFMWLYAQAMGIRSSPSVVIPFILLLVCQHLTRKTQRWLCVPGHGSTSHLVVMPGYVLHLYRKRCTNHIVTVKVMHPSSWRQQLVGNSPGGGLCGNTTQATVIRPSPWLYLSFYS